jgi:hypothetical protein
MTKLPPLQLDQMELFNSHNMAHYALLNYNNIVTKVITGKDETSQDYNMELVYQDIYKQVCKRTSYNTRKGVHTQGGIPFRKNYAGIGYTYDESKNAFIPPKPYASWVLNEETCLWESPVNMPEEGGDYEWNENTQQWVLIQN